MNAEIEYMIMKNKQEDLRRQTAEQRRVREARQGRPSLLARILGA
ncbi:hypothetical protein [Nonomuraea longicatena]|uniref:Uncharacterized protein n=1 Tax=Nonomuraea longicatena TaxID=83682 RepID=A0ABN1QHJ0_9ACTN